MPAETKARKDPGLTNIDPCYRSRRAFCNSSFRTLRHELVDEHRDIATASLIENWIDEAEHRAWFLFESGRREGRG
jgi:hypothetical protein